MSERKLVSTRPQTVYVIYREIGGTTSVVGVVVDGFAEADAAVSVLNARAPQSLGTAPGIRPYWKEQVDVVTLASVQ